MHALLQINIQIHLFKTGIFAFLTAFAIALITMPPLIRMIRHYHLFDVPDSRKEHQTPVPTMGGIAAIAGMIIATLLWFRFSRDPFVICFFFSVAILFFIGIMDDLRNLAARYKFIIQIAVSLLIAFAGVRIDSFNGMLGIGELPVPVQYALTVLAITGITNAFNLIDGIDGLAGGLGFMSLITLGLFLSFSGEANFATIAFAMSGGLLGFLYYNFNPARIFMGDTGSLVLGFIVAVLSILLLQKQTGAPTQLIPHAPVFLFSIVAIPVFDTLRVFSIRILQGRSPFSPDKNHIHHLLTNNGWNHRFAARLLCCIHAFILGLGYLVKALPQWAGLGMIFLTLGMTVLVFRRLHAPGPKRQPRTVPRAAAEINS